MRTSNDFNYDKSNDEKYNSFKSSIIDEDDL